MKISSEAVEAAAGALWQTNQHDDEWASDFPTYMDYLRSEATKALEAAAPHMHAQALEEAVEAFPLETIVAPDNAVVWMMRRAESLKKRTQNEHPRRSS